METCRLKIDLANVYDNQDRFLATMAWGDEVEVVDGSLPDRILVRHPFLKETGAPLELTEKQAYIRKPRKGASAAGVVVPQSSSVARVLKVDFVDVQQGDAAVLETPSGKVVLVDGGDNQLFARYLASRFRDTSAESPKEIDCIVVTHGDADHFSGLSRIHQSETEDSGWKKLFISPRRVFHNGLVKRPSKKAGKRVPDRELLGATVKGPDGRLVIVGLEDDLRTVPTDEMNVPFKEWRKALDAYTARGALQSRALAAGDDDAFDFLAEDGVVVKVLGPLRTVVDGRQGLVCLGEPTDRIGREPDAKRSKGVSASHTINGHSVILHITFGGVRFVFAGDLNEEAEESLVAEAAAGRIELEAEVLKVPHHGSADYFAGFFAAVAPVVSVVSSGDENEQKEYIHPRATLMGALGRHSRAGVDEPLVLVTELAAFFKAEGFVAPDASRTGSGFTTRKKPFFAFTRSAFGIVKVRTDGERFLVYTYSGKDDLKEAYAFKLDGGRVVADRITKV